MSVDYLSPSAAGHSLPVTTIASSAIGTDAERWAAWYAKGKAHDAAVRRKLSIAIPIALAVAAILAVVFLA